MPTFRSELPAPDAHQGYAIKRTPQTGNVKGIITCDRFLVCDTHYYHGRTQPCERQTNEKGLTIDDSMCFPCQNKIGWRTHVYVSAYNPHTAEHFLFECTAAAAKPLDDYVKAVNSLRGCIFEAARANGKPNGKVQIATRTADLSKQQLPSAPNLQLALAVLWRIPLPAFSITDESRRTDMDTGKYAEKRPNLRTKPDKMRAMREPADNDGCAEKVGDILGLNPKPQKANALA